MCLRCCLIDLTLGSCEQYVLAFSAFLDGLLDRSSDERLTVLVDNRPGEGAPCPCPSTSVADCLVGGVQSVSVLQQVDRPSAVAQTGRRFGPSCSRRASEAS